MPEASAIKIKKESNTVNTCDMLTVLAFCNYPYVFIVYLVSFNFLSEICSGQK